MVKPRKVSKVLPPEVSVEIKAEVVMATVPEGMLLMDCIVLRALLEIVELLLETI